MSTKRNTKRNVVIGFLGTREDRPGKGKGGRDRRSRGKGRFDRYRPTVGLFEQDTFPIDRFEMLVDKDPDSRELADLTAGDIHEIRSHAKVRQHEIDLPDPWDFEDVYSKLYDFAKSYDFDLDSEEYYVHVNIYTHVAQICMFLLAESRYIPAKLLQSVRSRDTPERYRIIDLELSKYDRIASRFQQAQRDDLSFLKSGIETRNPHYNRMIEELEGVASRTADPILLLGPTGAGKTRLAECIFKVKESHKQLRNPKLRTVNCASIADQLMDSELFGHVKGAFTGATQNRKGLFVAADGGMLFLDEIGEMDLRVQAKVLRAIEEKKVTPVGSNDEKSCDFQIICSTHRDLYEMIRQGKFREDLFNRISQWVFNLPGLAERPEDIEPNLHYELNEAGRKSSKKVTMNKEAQERFLECARSPSANWKGNFRDLRTVVQRMATWAEGGRITTSHVDRGIEQLEAHWDQLESGSTTEHLSCLLTSEQLADIDLYDRLQLEQVLSVCRNSRNLADAGRKLFHVSRQKTRSTNDSDRLRKYLQRFGIKGASLFRNDGM